MFFLWCCYGESEEAVAVDSNQTLEIFQAVIRKRALEAARPPAQNPITAQAVNELMPYVKPEQQNNFAANFQAALQGGNYAQIIAQLEAAQIHAIRVAETNAVRRMVNPRSEIILNMFQQLAQKGCWHTLLISILTGHCNPDYQRIFNFLAEGNNKEFGATAKEEWEKLFQAPRSIVAEVSKDNVVTYKASLEQLLTKPLHTEIAFAYVAFRFLQPEDGDAFYDKDINKKISSNNKVFYAICINHLLQNCLDKQQPLLLALLCLSHVDIIDILTPTTKDKLRPQIREYYPAGETFICGAEVVVEVKESDEVVANVMGTLGANIKTLNVARLG